VPKVRAIRARHYILRNKLQRIRRFVDQGKEVTTWSQGGTNPLPSGPSEFEHVVARLKLSPDEYAGSP